MMKRNHIKRIAHITIGVSNLKKSVSFYQDVLGLEKMGEWPTYAIFDIAGVSFGLEPKDQPWGVRDATFVDADGNKFVIESLQCKVCGKICQSYPELLKEHLRKHK